MPRISASIGPLLAGLLAGCAAVNSPEACRIVEVARAPLDLTSARAIVDVTLDGRPARMLLDTGASGVLVNEAAVARLGLHYDLRFTVNTASLGASALSRATEPVAIAIGSARLEPANFLVTGPETQMSLGDGIDGLLGTSVLAGYDVDIDMPRHRLVLYQPRRCPAHSPIEGSAVTFQVAPNPGERMHIPVVVDGHELSFLVDTGANVTYVNVQRAGLRDADLEGDRAVPVRTTGPEGTKARVHRFGRVEIGHDVYRRARLLVGPLQTGEDGLLGTDYLRHRRLWISFAGWAVTLQQPP